MHSFSKILALWAAASLSLTVAMPPASHDGMSSHAGVNQTRLLNLPGTLAPRDFSIVITDTQDRLPAHRLEETCDDDKCNELCYQRGGFVGGNCGDAGKCECTAPSADTDLRAQGGTSHLDQFFYFILFLFFPHQNIQCRPFHANSLPPHKIPTVPTRAIPTLSKCLKFRIRVPSSFFFFFFISVCSRGPSCGTCWFYQRCCFAARPPFSKGTCICGTSGHGNSCT